MIKIHIPVSGKGVIFHPHRTAQHTQSLLYIVPHVTVFLPVFFPNINKSPASGNLRTVSALSEPWAPAKTVYEKSLLLWNVLRKLKIELHIQVEERKLN